MATSLRAPLTALVLAAIMWGFATTATKYALRGFPPATLLAVALFAATVVLWTLLVARGYRAPRSWRRVTVLGLLEPALAYLCEATGLQHTTASNGAVITGLESALVVLLAAGFLGESFSPRIVLAVLLASAGLLVLEGTGQVLRPRGGDVLVLTGVLSAAVYTIVARAGEARDPSPDRSVDAAADPLDSLSVTAHQFLAAVVVVLPAAAWELHQHPERSLATVSPRYWVAAIGLGVLGYGLCFVLYNWSIASVTAAWSAVILNLIPAFGLIGAMLFLGERLAVGRWLGVGLIAASVGLFTALELRGSRPDELLEAALRSDPRTATAVAEVHAPGAHHAESEPASETGPEPVSGRGNVLPPG